MKKTAPDLSRPLPPEVRAELVSLLAEALIEEMQGLQANPAVQGSSVKQGGVFNHKTPQE